MADEKEKDYARAILAERGDPKKQRNRRKPKRGIPAEKEES
jgi:hypothetical protein